MDTDKEIERLRRLLGKYREAHAALLFAFIDLVDTGEPKPFPNEEPAMSPQEAFESIQLLNKWRAENKLNIKAVDVM